MTVRVVAYGPPDVAALLRAKVDHLYAECPLLRRMCRGSEPRPLNGVAQLFLGAQLVAEHEEPGVDPLGTDICGWCRRVWRSRHREETT